jgi:Family of unknown function (DUF6461)
VTAADYAWFEDRPAGLAEAYCLTLAQGLPPAGFLARVAARPGPTLTGAAALFAPSMLLWDEHPEKGMLIGVTTVPGDGGDWALAVEANGYLGVTEEIIVPLSAGTRVISHYYSNGVDRFYWVEDRDIRLHFNPSEAAYRDGSTPDAAVDLMREAGFDLSPEGDNTEDAAEASLALAERLTGVRLTPELLEQAIYTCGIAPVPPF